MPRYSPYPIYNPNKTSSARSPTQTNLSPSQYVISPDLKDDVDTLVKTCALKYGLPLLRLGKAQKQLRDMVAWLLFFNEKNSQTAPTTSTFNINSPFSAKLDETRISDFIKKEVLKEIPVEQIEAAYTEIHSTITSTLTRCQENDWFDLPLSAKLFDVDGGNFNRWPKEIKQLALLTIKTESANFDNANLSGLDLQNINFFNAKFQNANLSNCNLSKSIFAEANCKNTKLLHVSLDDVDFSNATLIQAKISARAEADGATPVWRADFSYANFSDAYIADILFQESILSYTKFEGSKLSNVIFCSTVFDGADFSSAHFPSLEDLPFELEVDEITSMDFDHINYGSSTLVAIHSLDSNKYSEYKKELVGKYIALLSEEIEDNSFDEDMDLGVIGSSLRDFFFKNPEYQDHPSVANFIAQHLLPNCVEYWNKTLFNEHDPQLPQLRLVIDYLLTQADHPNWLIHNSPILNQLLAMQRHAQRLNLPLSDDLKNGMQHLREKVDNDALLRKIEGNEKTPLPGDLCFFFNENGTEVLACSEDLLFDRLVENSLTHSKNPTGIIANEPQWAAILRLSKTNTPDQTFEFASSIEDLETTFANYPFLISAYLNTDPKGLRADFIRQVFTLDDNNTSYGKHLLNACKLDRLPQASKWISPEHQERLAKTFNAVLIHARHQSQPPALTALHKEKLIATAFEKIADLAVDPVNFSPTYQATFMLALAAFYCHASSSSMFGSENNSPESLRRYTSALLHEAYTLDKRIFGKNFLEQVRRYQDWQNRLLGREEAFTCTAVLADMLIQHINTLSEKHQWILPLFSTVYPFIWR